MQSSSAPRGRSNQLTRFGNSEFSKRKGPNQVKQLDQPTLTPTALKSRIELYEIMLGSISNIQSILAENLRDARMLGI
jgi:hypothetical protein